MINRSALVLKYKLAAIRWINDADPVDGGREVTVETVNADRTVYLISDEDGDSEETISRWIKRNYKVLFESELEGWYTDPSLWPAKRTLKLFREWFEVECHTVLIDTVKDAEIHDDDI